MASRMKKRLAANPMMKALDSEVGRLTSPPAGDRVGLSYEEDFGPPLAARVAAPMDNELTAAGAGASPEELALLRRLLGLK